MLERSLLIYSHINRRFFFFFFSMNRCVIKHLFGDEIEVTWLGDFLFFFFFVGLH